jgi:hypothetical protein
MACGKNGKTGWNIFELPDLKMALETVLIAHEDPYGGNRFNEFSQVLDAEIEGHEIRFKDSRKEYQIITTKMIEHL